MGSIAKVFSRIQKLRLVLRIHKLKTERGQSIKPDRYVEERAKQRLESESPMFKSD